MTGHTVKARKSRQKGVARIQAARPSRSRERPREGATRTGGRTTGVGVVVVMSLAGSDGLRLLLGRLQRRGRIGTGLGDLLQLGVELRDHLLPGRERRR